MCVTIVIVLQLGLKEIQSFLNIKFIQTVYIQMFMIVWAMTTVIKSLRITRQLWLYLITVILKTITNSDLLVSIMKIGLDMVMKLS